MWGSKKSVLNIAEYITNGKNLKNKTNCSKFSFGIISFSSYVSIETMNIISSDVEMNKVFANHQKNLFYCCLNN